MTHRGMRRARLPPLAAAAFALFGLMWNETARAAPQTHDDLQLRLALGTGYWLDFVDPSAEVFGAYDLRGVTASLKVSLGGSVARGLTLGGTFAGTIMPSPTDSRLG